MIPGTITRISDDTLASAATIHPKNDLVRLTGTTAIANITPTFSGFSGILFLVPTTGNVNLLDTGNIAVAVIMPVNRVTALVYSRKADKWYPGAIS